LSQLSGSIMHPITYKIVVELMQGEYCSGSRLAAKFSVSRTAIWKHIQELPSYGLDVYSLPGKGYKLSQPLQLLDYNYIFSNLDAISHQFVNTIYLLPSVDSTNRYLRSLASSGEGSGSVVLAEFQSEGKGRRGRQWVSPFGCNLYCSILWHYSDMTHGIGGLSLAIGVAVVDTLEDIGIYGVQLKWPNDLLYNGRKLGGILLEMSGDPNGDGYVIIGVGINVDMASVVDDVEISQPWVDLVGVSGRKICRNRLSVALLQQITSMLASYQRCGLLDTVRRWNSLDAMYGKVVRITGVTNEQQGVSNGIDESGALLLKQGESVCRIHSGEVSLRLAD